MSHPVAETILEQLGGSRFRAMTGATNFIGSARSLSFQIAAQNENKIKGVKITLEPSDTYTVEFLRKAPKDPVMGISVGMEVVSSHEGIYADRLQSLFTDVTGLLTKL